jgi:DNA-binding beta-propeller fold protein YncE
MTDPGNVQMFSLNPDTCTITPIGAPLPTGGIAATLIDFAPNGTCISVGNEFSNTVSIFSINPTTCQATLVGTPVPAGPNPIGGAFSPDSTCLAVTNLDIFGGNPGTINTYSIDPATCVATPVSSGIPSGGFFPTSIDFSPISNCVAVANSNLLMGPGGNLQLFKFNPATCTLIQTGGPIATGGSNPITLSYSPDGLCLAVANIGSGTITLFNTTTTGCGLTPIGAPIATGNFPRSVAYSPDNRCLAVANSDFSPTGGGLIGPGSVSLFRTNFVTKPIIQALIERCSIVITGTADARTTIVVFQDGNAIGSTTTDALGNFSFTVKKHGTKIPIFTAQGVNAAGCISLISQPATLRSATSVALRTKYCSLTTSN